MLKKIGGEISKEKVASKHSPLGWDIRRATISAGREIPGRPY